MADAPERTGYEGDSMEKLLARMEEVAHFERAGFGFPNDRVRIVSKHMDGPGSKDSFTELVVGEDYHPDEYIKNTTKLYRQSWFVPLVRELRRRFLLSEMVEERRKESASLRQNNTEARAKLENLRREIIEAEVKIRSLEEAEKKLREHKAELSRDLQAMHEKKAFLAGELPTPVKASKRQIEL